MAFVAGWQTDNYDGEQFGHDMAFDCPDETQKMREVWRTSDKSWEAAKGSFRLEPRNKWDSPTFVHVFAFEMVECNSVCWRIGVAHEEFPVHDCWSWFKTLQVGEAPPWGVFLAGGKTHLQGYPPSILKAGELKINKEYRDPKKVVPIAPMTVLDGAGRIKLRKGKACVAFFFGVCAYTNLRCRAHTRAAHTRPSALAPTRACARIQPHAPAFNRTHCLRIGKRTKRERGRGECL
jgi:hypothetical protein